MLVGSGFCGTPANGDQLGEWWGGKYLTGDWFGVRTCWRPRVEIKGKWSGCIMGLWTASAAHGIFDQELAFDAEVNAAKLTGFDALEGLTAFGGVRWRDPRSPRTEHLVQGNPMFNPGRYQSGTQWRLTHSAPPIPLRGFRNQKLFYDQRRMLQPQKDFMVQPLSCFS